MHLLKTLFLYRSTKFENYSDLSFFRFQEEKAEFARKINEPDDGCGTCGFWRESLQPCNKCGKVRRDLRIIFSIHHPSYSHSVRMSVTPTDSHSVSHAFGTYQSVRSKPVFGAENISVLLTSSHHQTTHTIPPSVAPSLPAFLLYETIEFFFVETRNHGFYILP